MDFLECDQSVPRPEVGQGEMEEESVLEIKKKLGLNIDDLRSAATIEASNQSAEKALHATALKD